MSSKLHKASIIAVAATLVTAVVTTGNSGAAAQDREPVLIVVQPETRFVMEPVIQSIPTTPQNEAAPVGEAVGEDTPASASSLAELVGAQPQPRELSRELHCLAGAVFFEARGESLAGQLAVGRVIVARSRSGRFADSYCSVVYQPSQFSFVRGNRMPAIRPGSRGWREAVAIAQIAHAGSWRSPVEGALYFHAARVSPGWRLTRMARVDNHVFYR
jgi:N-acetylmuramoyl-L-alanine amidase